LSGKSIKFKLYPIRATLNELSHLGTQSPEPRAACRVLALFYAALKRVQMNSFYFLTHITAPCPKSPEPNPPLDAIKMPTSY